MAAVLTAGGRPDRESSGAFLSHWSAARLWELSSREPAVEVTRRAGHTPSRSGLLLHRTRGFGAQDVTRRFGIPVTTIPRTLADLCGRLSATSLQRLAETGLRNGTVTEDELWLGVIEANGRHGQAKLRAAVERLSPASAVLESPLEAAFLDLVRTAGLDEPMAQPALEGSRPDFLWPRQRVVVEVDGFAYHRHRFEEDRQKDLDRAARGFRTVRVTKAMIDRDPTGLVERLRHVLEG